MLLKKHCWDPEQNENGPIDIVKVKGGRLGRKGVEECNNMEEELHETVVGWMMSVGGDADLE